MATPVRYREHPCAGDPAWAATDRHRES
jgi:hypothetical protein